MRIVAVALTLLLAGCATSQPLPADPAASLDPIAFFSGRTTGEATLDTLTAAPVRVTVHSRGARTPDGSLVLDQMIAEGGKEPRVRRWIMRPQARGNSGPARFTGTLTDAQGPVAIAVTGPRAEIRYTMHNGFEVRQQLALQPGGRTLLNRLTVHRFGMQVARLDETIRKLD